MMPDAGAHNGARFGSGGLRDRAKVCRQAPIRDFYARPVFWALVLHRLRQGKALTHSLVSGIRCSKDALYEHLLKLGAPTREGLE